MKKRKITTKTTTQGIKIIVPHHLAIFDNIQTLYFVLIWFWGWVFFVKMVEYLPFSNLWSVSKATIAHILLSIMLLPLLGILLLFFGRFFGRMTYIICTSQRGLTLRTSMFGICITKKTYDRNTIHNLRLARTTNMANGNGDTIYFDYPTHPPKRWFRTHGEHTIGFGAGLDMEEAKHLAKYLTDVLEFRCDVVKQIMFGMGRGVSDETSVTLHDPDVSTLTTPFMRLKNLMVHTETYDFHQIERFITYAVNYIGQDYLRNHVDVHLYGDTQKLHANLYNSLTNLCKSVTVYKVK